jgi:hypothetical protein
MPTLKALSDTYKSHKERSLVRYYTEKVKTGKSPKPRSVEGKRAMTIVECLLRKDAKDESPRSGTRSGKRRRLNGKQDVGYCILDALAERELQYEAELERGITPVLDVMANVRAGGKGGGAMPRGDLCTTIGRYKVLEGIGEGSFGNVMLASGVATGLKVAVKAGTPSSHESLQQECNAYRALTSACSRWRLECGFPFLRVVAHDLRGPVPWLALEYFPSKTLHCFLGKVNGEVFMSLALQLVGGIAYLHEEGIMHLDLKTDNVLYAEHTRILKIIDFGKAHTTATSVLCDFTKEKLCNEWYRPPELWTRPLRRGLVTPAVDTWDVGLIVFALAEGFHPIHFFRRGKPGSAEDALDAYRGARSVKNEMWRKFLGAIQRLDMDWRNMILDMCHLEFQARPNMQTLPILSFIGRTGLGPCTW